MKFRKLTAILVVFLLPAAGIYAQCTYTSTGAGTLTGTSTWSTSGTGCGTRPSPDASNTWSTTDVININHNITHNNTIQLNSTVKVNINANGTLDLGTNSLTSSWGGPTLTIATNGTLKASSISWAIGNFTNSGTVTTTGAINFDAGTIKLSASGTTYSNITATTVTLKNSSTTATIDGRLNLTGNLSVNSGAKFTISYRTSVSGYIDFAGGQNMLINPNVYVKAANIYVSNNSDLKVNGYMESKGVLKVGLTAANASSGSSKISGSGTVQWATGNNLWVDNNTNSIDCAAGSDLTNCGTCVSGGVAPSNPFSLADCSGNVLPVKFISFSGYPSDNTVILNWVTAMQKNNLRFIIEKHDHSGDEWVEVGETPGEINSDKFNTYTFTDQTAMPGKNYYRIRQVDTDGASDLSDVISVETSGNIYRGIFPQPFKGDILFVHYAEPVSWTISSLSGKQIGTGRFEADNSLPSVNLSELALRPDTYIFQVVTNEGGYFEKLIVSE
jgi:hypothetical protein